MIKLVSAHLRLARTSCKSYADFFFPHKQKSPTSSSLASNVNSKHNCWETWPLRQRFAFKTKKNSKKTFFTIIDLSEPLRYETKHILESNYSLAMTLDKETVNLNCSST